MDAYARREFERTLESGDARRIRFHYDRDLRVFDYTDDEVRAVAADVQVACRNALGDSWNHYSNALRPEVCSGFGQVIRSLNKSDGAISYLEVGSNQGVSMAFFYEFIRRTGAVAELVSVDPYYESGYFEGSRAPLNDVDLPVSIDKSTRDAALRLYRSLGARVRLIEKTSREALIGMLAVGAKFDIVYIDGSHQGLNPIIDVALAECLVNPGGAIILDDWNWQDVLPIKLLYDEHAEKIYECWKIAAYRR